MSANMPVLPEPMLSGLKPNEDIQRTDYMFEEREHVEYDHLKTHSPGSTKLSRLGLVCTTPYARHQAPLLHTTAVCSRDCTVRSLGSI